MARKNKKNSAQTEKAAAEIKDSEAVEITEDVAVDELTEDEAAEEAEVVETEDEAIEQAEAVEAEDEATEEAEAVEAEGEATEEAEAVEAEDEAIEQAEAVEAEDEATEEAEAVEAEDEAIEQAEAVEAEGEATEEAEAVEAEGKATEEAEAVEAEDEATEEAEAVETEDEATEEAEAVEAEDEATEEAEAVEAEDEATEEAEAVEAEDEATEEAEAVEAEDETTEEAEAVEAEDEIETIEFEDESDDSEDIVDLFEEANANTSDEDSVDLFAEANAAAQAVSDDESSEFEEIVDDDDYLDYDDDVKRPKKIVSGKTAVITMLFTLVGMIAITAGIFSFLTYYQKDTGIPLVSYTDRFNVCDANSFSYGEMLGLGTISYSDTEMSLTEEDIKALKSGKTVTKFNGMANITADVRFNNIVSMDFSFSDEINNVESPSGYYMMLAGNLLSGFYPGVETSDYGFMLAYSILSYAIPVDGNENVYCYQMEDVKFYIDYTETIQTGLLSKLTIHVESAEPHYLDWSEVDLSWIPWNKDNVSSTDISGSDTL